MLLHNDGICVIIHLQKKNMQLWLGDFVLDDVTTLVSWLYVMMSVVMTVVK